MTEQSKMTGTEMQMLMQMMSNIQAGVERVDRKLDGMVPRPEFTQYQEATDRRFAAVERQVSDKQGAHDTLDAKIQAVDDKVDANERRRNDDYRSVNTKAWAAIGGAALAIISGIIVGIATNVIG